MLIKHRPVPETSESLNVLHPVLNRIYKARGITDNAQLELGLQELIPFYDLSDIQKAVSRLANALNEQEHILIVGDFDADGATSSALAVSALRTLGAKNVSFLVPNRFDFGYGLTPAIVEVAKTMEPKLIVTVDNGIASIDGVQAANEAGIDVVVTDHHLAGETLPNACAIVNPNQPGDQFASKSIAGVGVIFYVMLALRRHLIEKDWFASMNIPEPNMAQFLDLVALGTVADVVSLDQNNRVLVSQGMRRIKQGMCRPGIRALIEVAGRKMASLYESDLGFAIAPRLNAAGRLEDMSLGIECLLCENDAKAMELAKQLDALNVERRKIEADMKEQAFQALENLSEKVSSNAAELPTGLCLMDDSWHQGVIGILAGRLKEKFHRPVIIFAKGDDEELKGSARSIPALNIRDVLAAIDKDNPGLIIKFGGHAMAAGLSIKQSHFKVFQQAFVSEVVKQVKPEDLQGELLTDGGLAPEELSKQLALTLKTSGPWGQNFPEPTFDNLFEVLDQRIVGERHLKLLLAHQDSDEPIDAIAFNIDLKLWPNHRCRYVHAAYRLDINEYAGRTKLQLIIIALNAENSATEPTEFGLIEDKVV